MTNYELIISEIGLLADALVNQEYCEKCSYNKKGALHIRPRQRGGCYAYGLL